MFEWYEISRIWKCVTLKSNLRFFTATYPSTSSSNTPFATHAGGSRRQIPIFGSYQLHEHTR